MSAARQAGATSLGMQSENFGYSSVRLRRIKKLQFGVVNPNELVGVGRLCPNLGDFPSVACGTVIEDYG